MEEATLPTVSRAALTFFCILGVVFCQTASANNSEDDSTQRHRDVLALYDSGQFLRALELARENLDVRQSAFGTSHATTAESLYALGLLLSELGRYEEAEPYLRQAAQIQEEFGGSKDPDLAHSLIELAVIERSTGDLEQSDKLIRRSLEIFEETAGARHPNTAKGQEYLGYFLTEEGKFDEARVLLQESLETRTKFYGDYHISTARSLLALGQYLLVTRNLASAEQRFRRAIEILLQVVGEGHSVTARARNHLGILLFNIGDLAGARDQFEIALRTREETLGPNHSYTAESLNNLASMLHRMAEYAEAKPLFERSLNLVLESRGESHPYAGIMLHNMARLRLAMGDRMRAKKDYERALEVLERSLGKQQNTAIAHVSLANALQELGDLTGAQDHLNEALKIQESLFSEGHLQTASTLDALGQLFRLKEKYVLAKSYLERAERIRAKLLGPENYLTAGSMHGLASLHLELGEFDEAIWYFEKALSIRERILGVAHPDTVATLVGLAAAHKNLDNINRAIDLLSTALSAEETLINATAFIGSRRQKQLFLHKFIRSTHAAVSLELETKKSHPRTTLLAVETILRRKGRLLDVNAEPLKLVRSQISPERTSALDALTLLYERQAYLSLYTPENVDMEARSSLVSSLAKEIEAKEESLNRDSAAVHQSRQVVSLDDVQKSIPHNAVLIELLAHYPESPIGATEKGANPRAHYVAYVIKSTGKVQSFRLDTVDKINRVALRFRDSISDVSDEALSDAQELYSLLFEEIRPALEGKNALILSPDGALNLIPFAALRDMTGRYLIEDFSVGYVSSGRDLLRWRESAQPREAALLLGDIAFDSHPGPSATVRGASWAASMSALYFDRLPATEQEVNEIAEILGMSGSRFRRVLESIGAKKAADTLKLRRADRVLMREEATESRVKAVRGPSVLHLATHGFFLPRAVEVSAEPDQSRARAQGIPSLDPLLRSGLALAGFNQRHTATSANDGVLTALEVMGLDLYGTEIVALSACESGLGDVLAGEGVFGLRRALALAGAKTQVLTLWAVDDRSTQQLMVSWYGQLKSGESRASAMQRAQLAAIRNEGLPNSNGRLNDSTRSDVGMSRARGAHPYYWAGLIVSGRLGPVDVSLFNGQ